MQRKPESNTEMRGQPGEWGMQEGPEQSARERMRMVPNLLGWVGPGEGGVCIK